MAFPSSLALISVHARFDLPPDGGATGRARFIADYPLKGATDNAVVPPFTVDAALGADGEFTVDLPATDDPQWTPQGWAYRVEFVIGGAVFTGTLQLAHGTAAVELADLLQVSGAAQSGTSYLALTSRGVAGGVAALDADGDVNDAAGNKIAGGGGGGGTPGGTVVSETSFGQSATAGATTAYSRADHTHGTPVNPVTAHVAAADPHTQYLLEATATTKGDLLVATGSAAVARLGVGTDGQVLTADAAQAGGVRWATPSGVGGGGSARYVRHGYVTSGNITPQNTGGAWALLSGGPTFTVPASVGSEIEFDFTALMQTNSSTFYDPVVIVGGAAVRYASTGGASAAVEGDPGLYHDTTFPRKAGPFNFTAESGDISGGNVTVGIAVKSGGAGVLYAGTAFPLRWKLTSETPA
jgi:hypothetical protein